MSLRFARYLGLLVAAVLLVVAAPAAHADDAGALYKQGIAYKNQGKDDDAIASLEKAVAADPRHGMAWASLGHLYKKKKDYGRSVQAYEKATALITKDGTLWANLGMAYYRAGRADEALSALTKACRLLPRDAEVQANLGTIKRQKGDAKGAILHLEFAVKYAPGEATYHNNLGVAYRSAERFPDARLWPEEKKARAHAMAISAEMHSGFVALRQQCPMNISGARSAI